jgi:hypothetical protein
MRIETVSYQVEWRKFLKGYSFFVPCIDEGAAREELNRVAKRLKLEIVTKVVLVDGIKGLRVWRV